MSPLILVGCPFRDRTWALPGWMEAVDEALDVAHQKGMVIFAYPFGDYDATDAVEKSVRMAENITDYHTMCIDEPKDQGNRDWSYIRISYITDIRNRLLKLVREIAPELFWSLDSDIKANPRALASAMELIDAYDAVGTMVNMDPWGLPSYANLSQGGLLRYPTEGAFEVDVIMASKVMTKSAYNIDYVPHVLGEDVGWAIACRRANLRLGWDGREPSVHLLERPENG